MKTTYYAQKELTIEGKQHKAGAVLATVQAEAPLERVLAGLGNGSVGTEPPKTVKAPAAAEPQKGEPK